VRRVAAERRYLGAREVEEAFRQVQQGRAR